MKQYIPDETTRLKAAFGSIQGMDPRMTKDVVLASIDTYLGVIEAERGKTKLRMEKLRKETVEDKAETTVFEARTNATIDKVRLTQIL